MILPVLNVGSRVQMPVEHVEPCRPVFIVSREKPYAVVVHNRCWVCRVDGLYDRVVRSRKADAMQQPAKEQEARIRREGGK